jgi:Ca-activated chloride channel family protein
MVESKYEKKAILLVTDGLDNYSKHSLEEAVEALRRARVAVYTIGLLSAGEGARGEQALLKIAEASGGRTYFPQNVEEVRAVTGRIARDLREQYTLGYVPTNPDHDGLWRSVRLEVVSRAGYPSRLTANYRRGYYGPGKVPDE